MSKRYNLFQTGFSVYQPSYYYGRQFFFEQFSDKVKKRLNEEINKAYSKESTEAKNAHENLLNAVLLADQFKINIRPLPQSCEEYYEWCRNCTDTFETEFPLTKIEYYYFFYARKLAEMLASINMIGICLELCIRIKDQEILKDKLQNYITEAEYVLYKLTAPSALLTGEFRHFYFGTFFKEINTEFERFKFIEVDDLSDKEAGLLIEDLAEYHELINNGYQKGVSLLKELGI